MAIRYRPPAAELQRAGRARARRAPQLNRGGGPAMLALRTDSTCKYPMLGFFRKKKPDPAKPEASPNPTPAPGTPAPPPAADLPPAQPDAVSPPSDD